MDSHRDSDCLSDIYQSDASYLPSLSYQSVDRRSLLAPHRDPATRPVTYGQLIDYLKMLSVPILERPDVVVGKKIGAGRSFLVQEGKMRDTFPHISVVAVKTSVQSVHLAEYRSSLIKEIIDEIRVMSHLARHRNVANLVGVILERTGGSDDYGGPFLPRLIVEKAVGSLASLLSDYRRSDRLPWGLKLKLCLDTAAGLEALHLVNIVHGDVKADNVLIFDNLGNQVFIAKVSDFGFCVPDTTWRDEIVAIRGTLRFQAPEALVEAPPRLQLHGNLPERDIYSFGVLLWEVLTNCRIPFEGLANEEISSLKLGSNDGAVEHLVASLKSSNAPRRFVETLSTTIRGTVRREPIGEGGRLKWQAVFDLLCSVLNDEITSTYFESRWKDFKDYKQRQPEMSFGAYRDFPWLPTIPEPAKTWLESDRGHSQVMLNELQQLTTQGDWIASIRLALHFFHIEDELEMQFSLGAFMLNSPQDLGEHGVRLLRLAVEVDAVPVIMALLQKEVFLDQKLPDGRKLLHLVQSKAAAQALINHGADVNIRDNTGRTPLHYASSADIARLLLSNGADVHARDSPGRTPLHAAQTAGLIQVLLHFNADVESRDRMQHTPLHLAVSDDVALALMSVSSKSLSLKEISGNTPLHTNIGKWKSTTVEEALRLGADPNELNHSGTVAYLREPRVLYTISPEVVKTLLKYGSKLDTVGYLGCTPLHFIASYEVMELFISNGCRHQVNQPDDLGNTPLHAICNRDNVLKDMTATSQQSSSLMWQRTVQSHSVDTLDLLDILLGEGADPNVKNNDGDTPLHIVARNTMGLDGPTFGINIALIRQLVQVGADVNARNSRKETPLHCAAHYQSIQTLLECGANPKLVDGTGASVLHYIIRFTGFRKDVISALVKHGAINIDVRDSQGFTPLHSVCGFRSDPMDYGKATPISEAILALLEHGAAVNARTKRGDTPLHLVSRQWFQRDEFQILLSHGADVTTKNDAGECIVMPWWRYEEA